MVGLSLTHSAAKRSLFFSVASSFVGLAQKTASTYSEPKRALGLGL